MANDTQFEQSNKIGFILCSAPGTDLTPNSNLALLKFLFLNIKMLQEYRINETVMYTPDGTKWIIQQITDQGLTCQREGQTIGYRTMLSWSDENTSWHKLNPDSQNYPTPPISAQV